MDQRTKWIIVQNGSKSKMEDPPKEIDVQNRWKLKIGLNPNDHGSYSSTVVSIVENGT